jgi:hypothetical protein
MMAEGQDQFGGKRKRACPADFAITFVRIGRLACEERFQARRSTVTRWLEESGKDALIEARRIFVRGYESRAQVSETFLRVLRMTGNVVYACRAAGIGRTAAYKWRDADPEFAKAWSAAATIDSDKLTRREMAVILGVAFPATTRKPTFLMAQHAAQYLRERRNGGWIISPAGDGLWWVGSRRRTAAELVAMAEEKGFNASTLRVTARGA